MLRAIPTGWFSTKYDLLENENPVGRIDLAFASESASFTIQGEELKAYREGWMSGRFLLESERNGIVASAEKPSAMYRSFDITYAGHSYTLEARSVFSRNFFLREGENDIGSIRPDHLFTTRSTIELPDHLPIHIQAFLFWLTAILWGRETNSAAAGGV
jgi:hypothetical protein